MSSGCGGSSECAGSCTSSLLLASPGLSLPRQGVARLALCTAGLLDSPLSRGSATPSSGSLLRASATSQLLSRFVSSALFYVRAVARYHAHEVDIWPCIDSNVCLKPLRPCVTSHFTCRYQIILLIMSIIPHQLINVTYTSSYLTYTHTHACHVDCWNTTRDRLARSLSHPL